MTHGSSATPQWRTACAVLLMAALSGCDHTSPFSDPQGTDVPFDPGPPARLTLNPEHDGDPAWLADGSGILYSSRQGFRVDSDVCLAELPPTGGSQRRLVCDVPGNQESTDAVWSAAAGADGRLALLSAGNGNVGGSSPVFIEIALAQSPLDAGNPQTVRTMPFTPSGGTLQNYAGYLRWLTLEQIAYVGQTFTTRAICPEIGCPRDTIVVGTEITVLDLAQPTAAGAVPGTTQATGLAASEDGASIFYTLANDTRIYRRTLAGGAVTVVHDFGPAGVARDVHAAGTRIAAVVGGRVAFAADLGVGPLPWDSGGILHVVDLGGDDVTLDTPGRLYRRPALSPDGTMIVAEGFPLVITGPPDQRDTTVSGSADLYLFGMN